MAYCNHSKYEFDFSSLQKKIFVLDSPDQWRIHGACLQSKMRPSAGKGLTSLSVTKVNYLKIFQRQSFERSNISVKMAEIAIILFALSN